MFEFFQWLVNWLASNYILNLAIFYLSAKLCVRYFIHISIDHPNDFWSTISWFSVDVCLLSMTTNIASDLPLLLGFNANEIKFWYGVLTVLLIVSLFLYLFFMKRRKLVGKGPFSDWRLFAMMSGSWFFSGISFYLTTLSLQRILI